MNLNTECYHDMYCIRCIELLEYNISPVQTLNPFLHHLLLANNWMLCQVKRPQFWMGPERITAIIDWDSGEEYHCWNFWLCPKSLFPYSRQQNLVDFLIPLKKLVFLRGAFEYKRCLSVQKKRKRRKKKPLKKLENTQKQEHLANWSV